MTLPCGSRRELSNEPFIANIGVDTPRAESGLSEVWMWPLLAYRLQKVNATRNGKKEALVKVAGLRLHWITSSLHWTTALS